MSTDIHVRIIYDGDCPFCKAYMSVLRLQEQYEVELVDARGEHDLLQQVTSQGFDLDEGMVVEIDGRVYHGDAAMARMAFMTAESGFLRRLAKWTFTNERRSRYFYPILRGVRNLTLRVLGHKKIKNLG